MTKKNAKTVRRKSFWANPKSFVTLVLLGFVAVSVAVLIARETREASTTGDSETGNARSTAEDRVVVYYFHGTARCVTCRTIEAYAKEAVESTFASQLNNGSMEFQVIDVETPATMHYIQDYQLYAPSVVVVRFEENAPTDWKNLDMVWRLAGDKNRFLTYIQDEMTAFMQREL